MPANELMGALAGCWAASGWGPASTEQHCGWLWHAMPLHSLCLQPASHRPQPRASRSPNLSCSLPCHPCLWLQLAQGIDRRASKAAENRRLVEAGLGKFAS